MKVALVVPGGVDRSGTHRVVPCLLALIERLVAAGDEVHVFALLQEPEPGSWSLLGASVHNAGRRPRSLRTIRAMLAQHRRARFDVIHAVCYWNRTAAVGAAASLLLRVPLVVSLVDGEVVRHPSIAFGGQRTWRSRLALRLAARRARAVTAQSDYMRDRAARVGIAASTVILGVDLRQWPPLPPRPRRDGAALRLLHVGRFTEVKDQATLLEAMAMARASGLRFELEVVGNGALSPQIRQTAQSLGLDGVVRFSPPMTQAELRSHVERADLLVVSSVHESGPMVALEAAIAGVPVVGTGVGYLADWHPNASVAVEVGNAAALAATIADLDRDEPRRLELAAAAQSIATAFDADRTADAMRRIYREAAAGPPSRSPG